MVKLLGGMNETPRACGHFATEWEMTTKESHRCVRCDRMWLTLLIWWRHPGKGSSSHRQGSSPLWKVGFLLSPPAGWVSPLFEISEQQRIPGLWQVTGGFVSYGEKEAAPDGPHTSATPATLPKCSQRSSFYSDVLLRLSHVCFFLFCLWHKSAFGETILTWE